MRIEITPESDAEAKALGEPSLIFDRVVEFALSGTRLQNPVNREDFWKFFGSPGRIVGLIYCALKKAENWMAAADRKEG